MAEETIRKTWLKDDSGQKIAPITMASSVYSATGTNIDELMITQNLEGSSYNYEQLSADADRLFKANTPEEASSDYINSKNIVKYGDLVATQEGADSNYDPQVLTLNEINNILDKVQLYGKLPTASTIYDLHHSNPNLLDNPWFTVNQRGQTSYSGGVGVFPTVSVYTVDRWKLFNNVTMNVYSNGITLVGSSWSMHQYVEHPTDFANKTVTISVKTTASRIRIEIYDAGGMQITSSTYEVIKDADTINGIASATFNVTNGISTIRMVGISSESSTTIHAVKLEYGSVSTLANDSAPDYAIELMKCQRYFYRLGYGHNNMSFVGSRYNANNAQFFVELPVPMRANPAISVSSDYSARLNEFSTSNTAITINSNPTATSFNDSNNSHLALVFGASNPSFAPLHYTILGGYIDFSADL